MNVTITKTYTLAKARADIKAEITEFLLECLREKYGTAEMVRTGSDASKSKTNEIGVITGEGTGEDGVTSSIVITLNPTVKEFTKHSTAKNDYVPFDFAEVKEKYDIWLAEKTAEEEAKAKAKAEQIAKVEAKKAEAKAKAE